MSLAYGGQIRHNLVHSLPNEKHVELYRRIHSIRNQHLM